MSFVQSAATSANPLIPGAEVPALREDRRQRYSQGRAEYFDVNGWNSFKRAIGFEILKIAAGTVIHPSLEEDVAVTSSLG